MFNPILASRNIKDEFVDYISTLFHIADPDYAKKFTEALRAEGAVTKGPYLDISDSYKPGKSLREMMDNEVISSLFGELEGSVPDREKELQLNRPLYLHQETAVRMACQEQNLVITTGTSSGKTECFIIPIINHLLREKEQRPLTSGVRAILVYPMNALANDQMKRLRSLLKSCPDITFGVYNSSTKQRESEGIADYVKIHKEQPLKNEILSRARMRQTPPHILVTNYAMMEHMLLRPKDDYVFSGAKLRFLVLDEAHIYRGATGMETSLLLKRLKARISKPEQVIHILTSATLGGTDSEIVRFAGTLCNADFQEENIIRAERIVPAYTQEAIDIPHEMFAEIADPERTLAEIAAQYGHPIPAGQKDEEYLYQLCLNSTAYCCLREVVKGPMTLPEITRGMNRHMAITEQDIVNIIRVAVQAEKDKSALMKARYHMFAKALEGAYITLDASRSLMLNRTESIEINDEEFRVFEAAVCDDCGSLAITGKVIANKLEFANGSNDSKIEYFYLPGSDEPVPEENGDIEESNFLVCSKCGAIIHESRAYDLPCGHKKIDYVRVKKAEKRDSNTGACPGCGMGNLGLFYLNYSAATAVLGTALFEELPELEKVIRPAAQPQKQSIFKPQKPVSPVQYIEAKRQFLSFSDNRSEAAYFACYMEASYQDFLRRRGIWHVAHKYKEDMAARPWEIKSFVDELTAYFDTCRTFAIPGEKGNENLTPVSRKNAWIAVLNEMVNGRRSNSLVSMGVIRFQYKENDEAMAENLGTLFNRKKEDIKALLDLLVMDIVYSGAVEGDVNLSDDERDYIYFTSKPKRVKLVREAEDEKRACHFMYWSAAAKANGKLQRNARLDRVMRALGFGEKDANEFLRGYWSDVLNATLSGEKDELYLKTDQFTIAACTEDIPIYRCDVCGRTTMDNCQGRCAALRCKGHLNRISHEDLIAEDHYAKLYSSKMMKPLHIREHTAQLGRNEQQKYQRMFLDKQINTLSCSTTFEMGVDVGDLETVYLRDMPPSPANYVQRAGRAGRSRNAAAFSLTYAKLGSHDFTYYNNPEDMITGRIGVPLFTVRNEKVILRHIFAVAFSYFFSVHENVYNGNNADVLLNRDGWEKLCEFLDEKPDGLKSILKRSIPEDMHEAMGIEDFSWVEKLNGKDGILTLAVETFRETVCTYEKDIEQLMEEKKLVEAAAMQKRLWAFRKAEGDEQQSRNELIEFLVRNNVLPKYGFPVDTVELHQSGDNKKDLRMMRDLQLAIGEYAPDSQVVADGKLYTSRYIRRSPQAGGKNWEIAHIAKCPNQSCATWNHMVVDPKEDGVPCVSCGKTIKKDEWKLAIEPRMGFIAEPEPKKVPMRKPERAFRGDDYYIGDAERQIMQKYNFEIDSGNAYLLETSVNDSLMVVCNNDFFVCERCGYAVSAPEGKQTSRKKAHSSPWQKVCTEPLKRFKLCHVFKTDVVRITFQTAGAGQQDVMLSVMYALLEAMSAVLDIERNDIKGCLHKIDAGGSMVYSIVLYDAVAGGAGHVRRMVTEDGAVFQQIIEKAIDITKNCSCSPSCYSCLRNYYNQKIHDRLNRQYVFDFLENFRGNVRQVTKLESGI